MYDSKETTKDVKLVDIDLQSDWNKVFFKNLKHIYLLYNDFSSLMIRLFGGGGQFFVSLLCNMFKAIGGGQDFFL